MVCQFWVNTTLNVPKMLSWQEAHICSRSTLTAQTYYRKRNIQRRSKYKSFTCCSTLNTRPPKFLRPFVCNDRILSWELFTLRCTTRDPWNQRFTFSLSPALDHYYSIKRYMSEGTFVPGSPCFWRDVFLDVFVQMKTGEIFIQNYIKHNPPWNF